MIARPTPRSPRRAGALAALAALLAVASGTGAGAQLLTPRDAALAAREDEGRLKLTVQRQIQIGEAMYAWLIDAIASAAAPEAGEDTAEGAPAPADLDWRSCPAISPDELEAVLVPAYLPDLRRTDGWGHPFEFCLSRELPAATRYLIGIRSPGRDGRWQGNVYPIGPFDPKDVDRDLVWLDGLLAVGPDLERVAPALEGPL